MKRLPKCQDKMGDCMYRLEWYTQNYHTGRWSRSTAYYLTEETAKAALEIAMTHKTKRGIDLRSYRPEPPNSSAHEVGGTWDGWLGTYLYSASY